MGVVGAGRVTVRCGACMYVCTYVCLYVCIMYVFMYVYMYVYIYAHTHIYQAHVLCVHEHA